MASAAEPQPRGEFSAAILAFRRAFYAVGAFSFAINLLLLVPAIYMLQIYDRVLSSRSTVTLAMLTIIMLGLYLLEAALEFVRSRVLIRTGAALDLHVSARVFDASFERYLRRRGGNAGQALNDLVNIRQFLTGKGLFAFFDAPWTPIYMLVIFLLSPWLGAFALAAAAILLALAWLNERVTAPRLAEAGKLAASTNQYAAAHLRNAEVIEAMGMLPSLRARWLARQNQFLAVQADASDRASWVSAVTRFFRLAMQSGILGAGALLVIDNQMTAGGMIAASILLGRALSPLELAISTWRGFVSARTAHARLNDLLDAHPPRGGTLTLPRPQGSVSADGLIVSAPGGGPPILKGISFHVPPGATVAVVGPSAAGKSTLARALVGVWAPSGGTLRVDAAEVHKWNKNELGPWVGYLPQDVELFEGTIAENISRFGELDAERIVHAAQRAGMHDMVLHLPQGYDTPIGEGGAVLSGGQRQRVALARALYGDPALIVLDEPNANLDDAGDAALLAALRTMKEEKRTVFIMTHRVNVLRVADAVMILVAGAIQAFGPRNEVLKALPSRRRPAVEARQGNPPAGEIPT
jgi:ATP-binding cassette, subfamily C, type I secretion system permease/ATPase